MSLYSSEHIPERPMWTCLTCGYDWPCPTRRRELTDEVPQAHIGLVLFMASEFVAITRDMPEAPAGILYGRMLGWIPRGGG